MQHPYTPQVLDNCQKEVAVKTKREGRGSNLRLGEPDVGFAKTSLYLDSFCGQKRGSKQLVMEAEPAASAPQQVRNMLGCVLRFCTRRPDDLDLQAQRCGCMHRHGRRWLPHC